MAAGGRTATGDDARRQGAPTAWRALRGDDRGGPVGAASGCTVQHPRAARLSGAGQGARRSTDAGTDNRRHHPLVARSARRGGGVRPRDAGDRRCDQGWRYPCRQGRNDPFCRHRADGRDAADPTRWRRPAQYQGPARSGCAQRADLPQLCREISGGVVALRHLFRARHTDVRPAANARAATRGGGNGAGLRPRPPVAAGRGGA